EDPPEDPPEVLMADNRTMVELLQAPTEGYEDAIVIPKIAANNFELKHGLINLVQNKQFFGHDKEDPHAYTRYFNKITFTMRVPNVPSSSIKLMLFPFSLEGEARIWLEKEPPRFILTWDDLVTKFANQFFPPSETTNLLVAKVSTSSSTPAISSKVSELKGMVRALLLDKKNQSSAPASSPTPAPVKVVEPNCVTCGGAHSYQNCLATNGNVYRDNIQETHNSYSVQSCETRNRGGQGPSANSKLTKYRTRPTPVIRSQTQTPISEPVVAPVSVLMPNLKPSIPYPSRCDNERRRDQANEQIKKFYEIFKDMSFEISFTNALILTPKFASTLKALIGNKEKLSEMTRTPMNEHCSIVILNKLPRKLGDPGKFLIPSEFPGMDECLALTDLGASINLMPLSTGRALIDVHKGELTLHIENEAITYNLDQTVRYSANYNQMTANKIDVICEVYSEEVLVFSDVTASGNPTPYDDPIVSTMSPTLTPFGDSDFLLFEEADAFIGLEDDPNSPKIIPFYYDPEGDILLLEAILNSEPLPPLPNHEQYMPLFKKELKVCEAKIVKSSVDKPPEVELKDLPPHLEYVFLEGDNKLPVIIAKELGDEEKSALIKVLKSHKRAIAWKLSDIQGINPEFYTHKILRFNIKDELIPRSTTSLKKRLKNFMMLD
nr:reverse transcriptase domain-containing protein [Tanacetum cinerariifolium]